ncbi:DUF4351 domain-containing protein [Aphanizomenon flos-aquae]|uniref:DUF4351 domain-containing protein n=1 Tax=Aphanizomenon flos-aquae TaxID=1176 RepID=UPI000488C84D|nr:DUF4351 domain-containing protein [Aphanizomenon flos-aquae]
MRLGIHSQLGYGLTGFYGHTVKQDWRGLLILRDRTQGLGWEVPYTELEIIMNMLDLEIVDITQSRFYQEIIEQGLQEGEANLVIRQLRRRLGELPESQCSQIKSFPVSQLEDLGEALLDFQGIDDLDDWLQKYTELS